MNTVLCHLWIPTAHKHTTPRSQLFVPNALKYEILLTGNDDATAHHLGIFKTGKVKLTVLWEQHISRYPTLVSLLHQLCFEEIFLFAITENRFQLSPRFHSSRSDCDVILTGNVVSPGLWFSWIIADSFAESNSPMTFQLLDAEGGSYNDFPHIVATEPSRSLRINPSM